MSFGPIIDRAIKSHPPMSAAEERATLESLPRELAEQVIVLHSLGYAAAVAVHFKIPSASPDDVFQYTVLAMSRAAKSFDPAKCGPEMRFTGFAKPAIERALLHMADPRWGSADDKMNHLTSTLSEHACGDKDAADEALDALMLQGRTIAGLGLAETRDACQPALEVDNMIAQVRKNLLDGAHGEKRREVVERALSRFRRVARGESVADVAASESAEGSDVSKDVNLVRLAIVRMALRKSCPEEWRWLFERSSTVRSARRVDLGDARRAWGNITAERDGHRSRRIFKPCRVFDYMVFALRAQTPSQKGLTKSWRLDRGMIYSAEGYKQAGRIAGLTRREL